MMRPWPMGVVLVASLAVGGCRSTQPLHAPLPAGFPDHGPAEVIGRLPDADSLWSSFRIDASLAFSTPDGGGSFGADILVRRPDSVFVRMRAPLGIEVARALITRDSVFLYDRVAKTLYAGSSDAGILPAGLHSTDLSAAFFGFDRPDRSGWSIGTDSLLYVLERRDGTETLLVDPSHWRITARDTRLVDGTVIERRRFTRFEMLGGIVVPRRIVTIRPREETRGSFFVRKVEPYPADTSMDLGVREDARRVTIR